LEISIFGPGFGECIVLHLGGGDWGVVDSCLDPDTKVPAALHYLRSLGVEVSSAVRFVIATHWHDDHMHGISNVFQETKAALFACTQAVGQSDFNAVLSSWTGTRFLAGGSGVDELRTVLAEIKRRTSSGKTPAPKLASNGKVLWERGTPWPISIKALSPSDAAILAAMARLRGVTPKTGSVRRRIPQIKPNDASVVLTVEAGKHRLLLGADLEQRSNASLGWKAVVEGFGPNAEKHQVFKLPHHGSPTGHSEGVWEAMLVRQPWSATTPFVGGRVRLPSAKDCERILKQTRRAYLTAPPVPGKFQDDSPAVTKTVADATRMVQVLPGKYGHVRIRKNVTATPDSDWKVELFGSALSLEAFSRGTG
jgi:hypothetical protein